MNKTTKENPMRMIVTGAGGVLGKAVVAQALAQGHAVVALTRHPDPTLPAAAGQVACADLADPAAARAALAEAVAWLGGLDALAHVAGSFAWVPFEQADPQTWQALLRANVESTVATLQAGLPLMADGGAVVCVGAASAQPAGMGMAPYALSKSGVARIVEALRVELAPRAIRINAVLPAIIDTPRNRADMPDADPAQWTTPEAIAEAILFLASPAARAVNGALLPVTNQA